MTEKEMLALIKKADKDYYENDSPTMNDEDYDALRSDFIKRFGSEKLNYVAGKVSKGFKSFKHTKNINSLSKIKFFEQDKLTKEITRLSPVVVEPKLDGLTIVAYPNGDGTSKFITRGNGSEGEILPNFKKDLMHGNLSTYPIRGEAFLFKSDFDAINKSRIDDGLEPFKNIRNAAAGILRRLDANNNPYIDKIQFLCYDVIGLDESELNKLDYINKNTPFNAVEYYSPEESSLLNFIPQKYDELMNGNIPIDGIVVKSNKNHSLELFGSTVHHPLNAFAWKAEQEQVVSTLLSVMWQVGKESVTPVAIFEPVTIDGTVITRASLHNWNNIKELGLHINDKIIIEKRNMIIPYVVSVIPSNNTLTDIEKPKTCPECGAELSIRTLKKTGNKETTEDEIDFYCPNNDCSGKLSNRISFVFSKPCLNAKGLSSKTIDKLISMGKVNSITDMFSLTKDDFLQLDGFKEKSADNMYLALQNCRNDVPFDKFIPACGVLSISFSVGKILANNYNYDELLDVLENKKVEELEKLNGLGEVLVKKLLSSDFIDAYKTLKSFVSISYPQKVSSSANAKTFVITGELSKPRSYFKTLIEQAGNKVSSSVSNKTFALVTDNIDSVSSKTQKAKELGIKIFDEEMLIKYLKENK